MVIQNSNRLLFEIWSSGKCGKVLPFVIKVVFIGFFDGLAYACCTKNCNYTRHVIIVADSTQVLWGLGRAWGIKLLMKRRSTKSKSLYCMALIIPAVTVGFDCYFWTLLISPIRPRTYGSTRFELELRAYYRAAWVFVSVFIRFTGSLKPRWARTQPAQGLCLIKVLIELVESIACVGLTGSNIDASNVHCSVEQISLLCLGKALMFLNPSIQLIFNFRWLFS